MSTPAVMGIFVNVKSDESYSVCSAPKPKPTRRIGQLILQTNELNAPGRRLSYRTLTERGLAFMGIAKQALRELGTEVLPYSGNTKLPKIFVKAGREVLKDHK
jgi:hypothetical protein